MTRNNQQKGMRIMFPSATTAQAEFTIDSATLRDTAFQLKLEKFVAQASDSHAHVAACGEWKRNADDK
jgi:hypothetical protein